MIRSLVLCGLACALCGCAARVKVVAHRGFHAAGAAHENTLGALRAAQRLGVWGSEFDVWITSDGVPVVHHDGRTSGGVEIESSPAERVLTVELPGGERIPSLKSYLAEGAKGRARLVVEIKRHSAPGRDSLAARIVMGAVAEAGLKNRVDYISFSRAVCDRLVAADPAARVWYLNGDLSPDQAAALGYTGIDYSLPTMRANPEWFARARRQGLGVNVWTVNDLGDMRWAIGRGAGFITTDRPDLALKIPRKGTGNKHK